MVPWTTAGAEFFFFGKRLFCIFLMDPKDLLALQASFLFGRMVQEVLRVTDGVGSGDIQVVIPWDIQSVREKM